MQDKKFVLLLIRGDHSLNEIKAQKLLGSFRFAPSRKSGNLAAKPATSARSARKAAIIADRTVAAMSDSSAAQTRRVSTHGRQLGPRRGRTGGSRTSAMWSKATAAPTARER
jgi:hypothetical protein